MFSSLKRELEDDEIKINNNKKIIDKKVKIIVENVKKVEEGKEENKEINKEDEKENKIKEENIKEVTEVIEKKEETKFEKIKNEYIKEFDEYFSKYDEIYGSKEKKILITTLTDIISIKNIINIENHLSILLKSPGFDVLIDILQKEHPYKKNKDSFNSIFISLLIFSTFIPIRFTKVRNSLEIISIIHIINTISMLTSSFKVIPFYEDFFNTIFLNGDEFLKLSLEEKYLLCSLFNLRPKYSMKILKNDLFKLELKRKDLMNLLFGQTGKHYQIYLNR
jgi:hypothetical protein